MAQRALTKELEKAKLDGSLTQRNASSWLCRMLSGSRDATSEEITHFLIDYALSADDIINLLLTLPSLPLDAVIPLAERLLRLAEQEDFAASRVFRALSRGKSLKTAEEFIRSYAGRFGATRTFTAAYSSAGFADTKWLTQIVGVGPEAPWLAAANRLNSVLRAKMMSAPVILRLRNAIPELSPTIQAAVANSDLRDLFGDVRDPRVVMECYDAFAVLRPAIRHLPLCPESALLSKRYDLMNRLLNQMGPEEVENACAAAPLSVAQGLEASLSLVAKACIAAPLVVVQELAGRFWGISAEGEEFTPSYKESFDEAVSEAARNGRLDVIQWLYSIWPQFYSRLEREQKYPGAWVLRGVAKNGHFEMLRWLYHFGHVRYVDTYLSFYSCFSGVAEFLKEHRDAEPTVLALVKWLRDQRIYTPEEKLPEGHNYTHRKFKLTARVCVTGSLPFLKALFETFETSRGLTALQFLNFGSDYETYQGPRLWNMVGRGGSVDMVQWLLATFGLPLDLQSLFFGACASGTRELLDWAAGHGTITPEMVTKAVDEAYLNCSPLKEELSRRYNYVPEFYRELEEINRRRGGGAEDLQRMLKTAGEVSSYWYYYPSCAEPIRGVIAVWPPPRFTVGVIEDAHRHGRGHFFPVDDAYVDAVLSYALGLGNTKFIEFFLENVAKPLGVGLAKEKALWAMDHLLQLGATHSEIGHVHYFGAILTLAEAGDLRRADLGERNFADWFELGVLGWHTTIEQLDNFVDRFALARDFYSPEVSARFGAYPSCSLLNGEDYGLWCYLTFRF